jgi:O-antigen ligase
MRPLTASSAPTSLLHKTIPRQDSQNTTTRPLALTVIILLVLLPEQTSFIIGNLRFNPIRLTLIILSPYIFIEMIKKILNSKYKFVISDLFVLLTGFWMILGPCIIVGFSDALLHSGPVAMEYCVSYFSVRALLSRHGHALSLITLLCRVIAIVAFLGLLDPLTHSFFIQNLVSTITHYEKRLSDPDGLLIRLGVLRATSTLEHPIALGIVSAIGVLLSAYASARPRFFETCACGIGVIISVTSAAWLGVILGMILMQYNRIMTGVKSRWLILIGPTMMVIILIFISIDRPLGFIFRHFVFDESNAWFREYTWDAVGTAVADSPWFGLGFEPPAYYEIPSTVDSVWLVTALTCGIPAAVLLALSIAGASLSTGGARTNLTSAEAKLATILGVVIFLILFWGFTVHFWGSDWILISVLVGVRAHLGELGRLDNFQRKPAQ